MYSTDLYVCFYASTIAMFVVVVQSLSCVWLFGPRGLQYARLPWPSPTPKACLISCPSSHWCHPTISSSVIPFFSCLQSFPASGSFPMNQLFISGGQSIGASALASVLPMNIQELFPLRLTDWFDRAVQGTLRSSSPIPQFKSISSLALSFVYGPTLTDNRSFVVKFWNWEVWVLQLCSNFSGLFWILWVPWSSLCFWRVISLWCLARIYLLTEASGVDLQICRVLVPVCLSITLPEWTFSSPKSWILLVQVLLLLFFF